MVMGVQTGGVCGVVVACGRIEGGFCGGSGCFETATTGRR